MAAIRTMTTSASRTELKRIIRRFLAAARQRGEWDARRRRRTQRRCHRSWPLVVSLPDRRQGSEMCVALHDASPLGIAFLCPRPVPVGTTLWIRLFWHDDSCPLVPAVVRHATRSPHGYLLGCTFVVEKGSGFFSCAPQP